jgi:methionyl-tRNA formyltransferase
VKKVGFVVNSLRELDFAEHIDIYLPDVDLVVLDHFPKNPDQFDIIVIWNFRKVINTPVQIDNAIVFHSSDLPKGRGWAPIYHAFATEQKHYTISGIKMGPEVDAGDLVVRARFPILPGYTAPLVRRFDTEISIMLVEKILARFDDGEIIGQPQSGKPTYYAKRHPEDNEINLNLSVKDIVPHLRACEPAHPAFFMYEGCKYTMSISTEGDFELPEGLVIEFFDREKP